MHFRFRCYRTPRKAADAVWWRLGTLGAGIGTVTAIIVAVEGYLGLK
jgi:hypothetical protein